MWGMARYGGTPDWHARKRGVVVPDDLETRRQLHARPARPARRLATTGRGGNRREHRKIAIREVDLLVFEVERGKCLFKIKKYRPGLTSPVPEEDSETGQAVGKVEAQETVDGQRARLKVIDEATSKAVKRAVTFYRARLWLLAAGIAVLLAGRMLAPYFLAPREPLPDNNAQRLRLALQAHPPKPP